MIQLPSTLQEEIWKHITLEAPKEACGVLGIVKGKMQYFPCRNVADDPKNSFIIHPEDWAFAEDSSEVVSVVHSHINISPTPSEVDKVGCEKSQLPWIIISWPSGQIEHLNPSGYEMPYIGREYKLGIVDCYSLVQDYYKKELNIELRDYVRSSNWNNQGDSPYVDNAEASGFQIVDTLEKHDIILMQMRSPIPNHAAIYIGNNTILHHLTNRLSSIDVYGGWYQKVTRAIYRHRSLIK